MSTQEVKVFSLKANQQLLDLITPSKATLYHKTSLVGFLKVA